MYKSKTLIYENLKMQTAKFVDFFYENGGGLATHDDVDKSLLCPVYRKTNFFRM
jgi:hypothetical protein